MIGIICLDKLFCAGMLPYPHPYLLTLGTGGVVLGIALLLLEDQLIKKKTGNWTKITATVLASNPSNILGYFTHHRSSHKITFKYSYENQGFLGYGYRKKLLFLKDRFGPGSTLCICVNPSNPREYYSSEVVKRTPLSILGGLLILISGFIVWESMKF